MKKIAIFGGRQESPAHVLLADFIYQHITASKFNALYKRRYRNIARHIKRFEAYTGVKMYIDSITENVIQEFVDYLRVHGRINGVKKNGEGLMLSSVSSMYNIFKKMVKKAAKKYNLDVEITVKVKAEETVAVYLTIEELQRINALANLSREARAVRDRFLVGCYTGLRYSDYSALSSKNIIGRNIEIRTKKTGVKVIIPIHPVVREIFDRNGGELPPLPSQQAFGATIKRVCRKAGIVDEVLYERTVGERVVRKRVKKYTLISSHTARRTAATNMYLAGIPTARIMLVTGHLSETMFFKYIRIERKANAETLAGHKFFSENFAD